MKRGDIVVNFDMVARVIDILVDGSLVLESVRFGRWVADPKKCRLYKEGVR